MGKSALDTELKISKKARTNHQKRRKNDVMGIYRKRRKDEKNKAMTNRLANKATSKHEEGISK
jgi:hypothetical protein